MHQSLNQVSRSIEEIEKSFGGKKYSTAQIQIIHEHAQRVPFSEFQKVCRRFLEQNRYKPLPIDFKNELRGYHQKKKQDEALPESVLECKSCYDTGLCFVRNDVDFDIVARCHCNAGIEKFGFPLAKKDKILEFPYEKFKPNLDESDEVSDKEIHSKVDWWKDILEISRKYWEEMGVN
jgi:hypothetical protein